MAVDPASEKPALPETTPVVLPPPAVEPQPAPAGPEPEPVRAESPPPVAEDRATTDRVLRGAAILSIVGAVMLAIGVRFPWDDRGRSWLDLKFGAAGIDNAGFFTGFAPVALVLGTLAALALAFRPRTRELGAGLLIGFGVAGAVKYLGLLGLALTIGDHNNGPRGVSPVAFTGVVAGAVLLVVAGVRVALLRPRSTESAAPLGIDRAPRWCCSTDHDRGGGPIQRSER